MPIADETGHCASADSGRKEANDGVAAAQALGLASGTVIFLDIEPSTPPDPACISAYADTVAASNTYKPGFYENTAASDFGSAFCSAAQSDAALTNVPLWTQQPQLSRTTKDQSPSFGPQTVTGCAQGKTLAWQYYNGATVGQASYDEDEILPSFRGMLG